MNKEGFVIIFPKIGEVYTMYFDGIESEQAGWRPGVVFQNNLGNAHSPNLIALPLTSSLKKLNQPTHVLLRSRETGLSRDSVVLCENLRCLSKSRLGRYITTLPESSMRQIAVASLLATSALSFLDPAALLTVWQESSRLNSAA